METEIIKSRRKTISVEITRDLRVVVRAPLQMRDEAIESFISEKSDWINKNLNRLKHQKTDNKEFFSASELKKITADAKRIIIPRTEYFAEKIGVEYGRITIKHQKTLWGSCSSKKNLNFNCLLVLCGEDVRDYVIIHELCHLKELNHSEKFWQEVAKYCPAYKEHKKWLKYNGIRLLGKMSE